MDLIPNQVRALMRRLEEQDGRDREDGTPRARRLRAVRPELGEFLLALALATGAPVIVEVGTSGGYSTLWLATAAMWNDGRVTTFDVDPAKVELAAANFVDSGVSDVVELRLENGRFGLSSFSGDVDLVFLDAEKEGYEALLEPAVDALRPGGLLAADNLVSRAAELEGFRKAALEHPRLSGFVVPVGRGELVAFKVG